MFIAHDASTAVVPIAFVNFNSANATTVTTATHAVGDVLIIVGWRVSNLVPGAPGGQWFSNATDTGAGLGSRVCETVATATNDASGTWGSAQSLQNANYRNAEGIGAISTMATGSDNTLVYPALTLQNTSGNSLVLRVGSQTNTPDWTSATLSGYTKRGFGSAGGTNSFVVWDSGGPVASCPSLAQSTSPATGNWRCWSIEILPA